MILIGKLDSPYVRRVAVCMRVLGIEFEHLPLSVFADFDAFAALNPVVKAPTLITPDHQTLMDSTLIISYLEAFSARPHLLAPESGPERLHALCLTSLALAACEKTVQRVYEKQLRPEEKQHQPWLDRVTRQLLAAWQTLEDELLDPPPHLSVAGISIAVAWSFTQLMVAEVVSPARFPTLDLFTQRAEQLPEFLATPQV